MSEANPHRKRLALRFAVMAATAFVALGVNALYAALN